ncbi:MAG TPA: hypothetical protein VMW52_04175, partial [Phycisphaerae bacterium]|nr:hypothetical protein [Phycisphaerae bacterium]
MTAGSAMLEDIRKRTGDTQAPGSGMLADIQQRTGNLKTPMREAQAAYDPGPWPEDVDARDAQRAGIPLGHWKAMPPERKQTARTLLGAWKELGGRHDVAPGGPLIGGSLRTAEALIRTTERETDSAWGGFTGFLDWMGTKLGVAPKGREAPSELGAAVRVSRERIAARRAEMAPGFDFAKNLRDIREEHPEWRPSEIKSAFDLLTSPTIVVEHLQDMMPYMAATTAATLTAGVSGGFLVAYGVESQGAYETATQSGATDEQAQTAARITGVANAVIELVQVGQWLKFGKKAGAAVASRKLGAIATAKMLAGKSAVLAFSEGLEEVAQGGTEDVTGKIVYGKPLKDFWNQRGIEFVLGSTAGLVMGAGSASVQSILQSRAVEAESAALAMPAPEVVTGPARQALEAEGIVAGPLVADVGVTTGPRVAEVGRGTGEAAIPTEGPQAVQRDVLQPERVTMQPAETPRQRALAEKAEIDKGKQIDGILRPLYERYDKLTPNISNRFRRTLEPVLKQLAGAIESNDPAKAWEAGQRFNEAMDHFEAARGLKPSSVDMTATKPEAPEAPQAPPAAPQAAKAPAAAPEGVQEQKPAPEAVAAPPKAAEKKAPPFTPTSEWQEVPEGAAVPKGLDIRMEMGGKNYARLMPEAKELQPFRDRGERDAFDRNTRPKDAKDIEASIAESKGQAAAQAYAEGIAKGTEGKKQRTAERARAGRQRNELQREIVTWYEAQGIEGIEDAQAQAEQIEEDDVGGGVELSTSFAGPIPTELKEAIQGNRKYKFLASKLRANMGPKAEGADVLKRLGTDEYLRRMYEIFMGKGAKVRRFVAKAKEFAEAQGHTDMLLKIERYEALQAAGEEARYPVETVAYEELKPGDKFTVAGDQFEVKADELGMLRVEDGITGIVFEGQELEIDKGSLTHEGEKKAARATEAAPAAAAPSPSGATFSTAADLFGRPVAPKLTGKQGGLGLEPGEVAEAQVGEVAVKPELVKRATNYVLADPGANSTDAAGLYVTIKSELKEEAGELFNKPDNPMPEVREALIRATKGGALFEGEQKPAPSSYGTTNTVVTQEAYEQAKGRLGTRKAADILHDESGAVDPERWADVLAVVGYHVEASIRAAGRAVQAKVFALVRNDLGDIDEADFNRAWAEVKASREKAIAEKPPAEAPPVETPAETKPLSVTSIKNAQVDIEREKRGLPPAMQPARRDFGTVWEDMERALDENPKAGEQLVSELLGRPRPISDLEDALLLHRQIELQNDYAIAAEQALSNAEVGNAEAQAAAEASVGAVSDA